MGFPIERYCFRNGCRWLLICLILGHYRWDGNQRGPVGFWVNKHFLLSRQSGAQIERTKAVWKKNNNISFALVVHRWRQRDCFCACGAQNA